MMQGELQPGQQQQQGTAAAGPVGVVQSCPLRQNVGKTIKSTRTRAQSEDLFSMAQDAETLRPAAWSLEG